MNIDGIEFEPQIDLHGPRQRILVAIDVDLTDANALLAHNMEGRDFGQAAPGHLLATAAANTIAAATWPPGIELRFVHATLQDFTASRGPA